MASAIEQAEAIAADAWDTALYLLLLVLAWLLGWLAMDLTLVSFLKRMIGWVSA